MEVEDIVNNFISNDIKTNIDDRSKYLTLLPALISTNSKEIFKDKLMEAVNHVDKESLKEAVYQTVPYLGYGKVYPFLVITEEVLGKTEDASTTNNDNRYSKGLETQYNLFGKENIDTKTIVTEQEATAMYNYLVRNNYIDDDGNITDTFFNAKANNSFADMGEKNKHLQSTVINIVKDIIERKDILESNAYNNARKVTVTNNLNDNFYKEEFQKLWNMINDKYAYRISFDSAELVENTIKYLDENLKVTKTRYTVETGEQKEDLSAEEIKAGSGFQNTISKAV